jgi:hypothetical protein
MNGIRSDVTNLIVSGVDKNFVHNLEEAGNVLDFSIDHATSVRIECP